MNAPAIIRIGGAALAALAVLLSSPIGAPIASADQCPAIQVIYARGTNEPPGLGFAGQVFTDSLIAQLPGRSVAVSAVDYPANGDYLKSSALGADDARTQIQGVVFNCPATKLVLGGYSQGAAVTELATSALPPQVADHVAAVVLFGSPSSDFSKMLAGGATLPTLSPAYTGKSLDLCIAGDPICSPGADMMAHVSYIPSGLTAEAATFAAEKISQSSR